MRTFAYILTLVLCLLGATTTAAAASSVQQLDDILAKGEASAQNTQAKLDGVTAQRDSYLRLLDVAADVSARKDDLLAAKDIEIAKRDQRIANDQKTRVGLISSALGVPGGLLVAAGVGAVVVLGLLAVGLKLIGGGSLLIAEGITVAVHADKIGIMGLWIMAAGAGVALLGVALWIAHDVKDHKDAGVENATLIPLAKTSGKFTAEQLEWLEQTAYIEGGKLADKLRAIAAGVSAKEVIRRGKEALGIKAS